MSTKYLITYVVRCQKYAKPRNTYQVYKLLMKVSRNTAFGRRQHHDELNTVVTMDGKWLWQAAAGVGFTWVCGPYTQIDQISFKYTYDSHYLTTLTRSTHMSYLSHKCRPILSAKYYHKYVFPKIEREWAAPSSPAIHSALAETCYDWLFYSHLQWINCGNGIHVISSLENKLSY